MLLTKKIILESVTYYIFIKVNNQINFLLSFDFSSTLENN